MYRKIKVSERLPEVDKWVTTIDSEGEHIVYRMTEHGWNMRDVSGNNSPNNNLPILYWLEEVNSEFSNGFLLSDTVRNPIVAYAIEVLRRGSNPYEVMETVFTKLAEKDEEQKEIIKKLIENYTPPMST